MTDPKTCADVRHYMLPPSLGVDLGPPACGAEGPVVLFIRNVTCPACLVYLKADK